jgi:pimeloyl-ACP methyl ester carboxylesterase
VIPRLAERHAVFVPTALGHRGGSEPSARPVRIAHIVDDAERCLDRLGIGRAHLAGNSMGGWVALELARRGRALSVCALSPAGMWDHGGRVGGKLRKVIALTRATRSVLPLLAGSATFRRVAMRDNARYGDRVTREEMLRLVEDMLACDAASDLLATDEAFVELNADCPVTLAWAEHDQIFPLAKHRQRAEALVPGAHFIVLPDVGHVPMIDDPALVVDTILESCAAARAISERVPTDVFQVPPSVSLAGLAARAER